jgi:hypothetical protein
VTQHIKSFWQSHEIAGYRAKVTIEWSWPPERDPPQNWLNRAEEIAEEVFSASGPQVYDVVLAMRGRTRAADGELGDKNE